MALFAVDSNSGEDIYVNVNGVDDFDTARKMAYEHVYGSEVPPNIETLNQYVKVLKIHEIGPTDTPSNIADRM